MQKSSITHEQDLTPFFTESLKESGKIEAARMTEREDGSRAIEIKFCDHIPNIERQIMIIAIGHNILELCASMDEEQDEGNAPFLELMDGAQIKEWVE